MTAAGLPGAASGLRAGVGAAPGATWTWTPAPPRPCLALPDEPRTSPPAPFTEATWKVGRGLLPESEKQVADTEVTEGQLWSWALEEEEVGNFCQEI